MRIAIHIKTIECCDSFFKRLKEMSDKMRDKLGAGLNEF